MHIAMQFECFDPEPVYLGKRKEWKIIKKFFLDHVQQFVLDLDKAKR